MLYMPFRNQNEWTGETIKSYRGKSPKAWSTFFQLAPSRQSVTITLAMRPLPVNLHRLHRRWEQVGAPSFAWTLKVVEHMQRSVHNIYSRVTKQKTTHTWALVTNSTMMNGSLLPDRTHCRLIQLSEDPIISTLQRPIHTFHSCLQ
jgi:hypothetical protein